MNSHGSDKGNPHTYTRVYEKLFSDKRDQPVSLLEIGIGTIDPNIESNMLLYSGYSPGASLRGWEEYFSKGRIYGCDIDQSVLFQGGRISTFFLDQKDSQIIEQQICNNNRTYDIIIDDGMHHFATNWQVLKHIFHKLNKGGVYIIEDVTDYDPGVMKEKFVKINEEKGCKFEYKILEKTEGGNNNLFIVTKPINSFDMFDTLVFRLNKTPESVLNLVKPEDPIFVNHRRHAEKNSNSKTLNGIYNMLQKYYGWSETEKKHFMDREMKLEYDNLFPVTENIRKVEEGDIIISDMYLPKNFLKRVLQEKCGLDNDIVVTYDGKHRGYIWGRVARIGQHLGDNRHSDGDTPHSHGITSKITTVCDYIPQEKYWVNEGYVHIANLMRFCRLQCPYEKGGLERIYMTTVLFNLPFLIMMCYYIHSVAKNYNQIVFSTRDCCYLYILYTRIFPKDNVDIFFSSRKCYYNPSENYHKYIRKTIPNNTLVVDMQGSGNSFNHYFRKTIRRDDVSLLFLNNKIISNPPDVFEFFNRVRFGTCIDVYNNLPVVLELEYPEYIVYPIEKAVSIALIFLDTNLSNIKVNLSCLQKYITIYLKYGDTIKFLKKYHKSGIKAKNIIGNCEKVNQFFTCITRPKKDDPIINIPIYLINRKQDQNRLTHIYELLRELGIPSGNMKVVNPVPASEETKQALLKYVDPPKFKCTITQASHSMTYFNIIANAPEEKILVLEDDISPINSIEDTKAMLKFIINNTPSTADMMYLEYCIEVCNKYENIFQRLNRPYCTAAIYYPSKKARQKIMHCVRDFHTDKDYIATDNTLARMIKEKIISGYEHKPIFFQDKFFGSFIEGSATAQTPFCENCEDYERIFYKPTATYVYKPRRILPWIIIGLVLLFLLGTCIYFWVKRRSTAAPVAPSPYPTL